MISVSSALAIVQRRRDTPLSRNLADLHFPTAAPQIRPQSALAQAALLTSVLGHSLRIGHARCTSAWPSIAGEGTRQSFGRYGPIAEIKPGKGRSGPCVWGRGNQPECSTLRGITLLHQLHCECWRLYGCWQYTGGTSTARLAFGNAATECHQSATAISRAINRA